MNKEEAFRCIEISKKHYKAGNHSAAVKFAKKSIALCSTSEGEKWLRVIETEIQATSSSQPANPIEREYTQEQVEAVQRIKKCGDDYYAILGLSKGASESEVKKAYRKLALQFHPDKNAAPGASEAFKVISNAFTVLSNDEKRKLYDMYGSEGLTPRQERPQFRRRRNQFGDDDMGELTPEDIFNMFFNGGDTFATFAMGGDRFQARARPQFNRRARQPDVHIVSPSLVTVIQCLPLIIMILLSLLNGLFPSTPEFSFFPTRSLSSERTTYHQVKYYVDEGVFNSYFQNNKYYIRTFEDRVETTYLQDLQQKCKAQLSSKNSAINSAKWWGNQEDLEKANSVRLPACEQLNSFRRQ